ncbi:CCA tRNA nucleotidyltransferase [Virgibacillus siamensis]|uniref:CCA tRNA nucleotidyltransferase n=1 Tax=Virgibacillus siamensis TaxID=480071 RepID=UPI0009867EE2|nr:CCA tRNA nucleotidyltransferase [Virgibacillus siamensis]
MQSAIFNHAKEVLECLEAHNFEAYFVGGCVRDLILERDIGDIDIATSASPENVQKIFSNVIPVGLQHGTVIVRHRQQSFEVTTFRSEGTYSDHRHPDSVTFLTSIDKDLQRRDFTINALAMDKDGAIIDLFHGRRDIADKIIRTVGNGYDRFQEDPLRIVRALRFSSQLGFSIHQDTMTAMKQVKQEIKNIAVERIKQEIEKLFAGFDVQHGLFYLKEIRLQEYLPVFEDKQRLLNNLPDQMAPVPSFGALVALFHYLNPEITIQDWIRNWKCSNKEKYEAANLSRGLEELKQNGLNNWLVYKLSFNHFSAFTVLANILFQEQLKLDYLMDIYRELPIHSKGDLMINGNEIKQLFPNRKSGAWIKEIINAVEYSVITGQVNNNKNDLKEWIKWNPTATN